MGWFTGSKPKVTTKPMWTPEQQRVGVGLGTRLQQSLAGLGAPGGIGEQTTGLISSILSGIDPLTMQAEGLLSRYLTGGGLEPEATRSYLENVIYGPMRKTLEEETLPGIQAAYGKGGTYFSTPRAAAETKARAGTEEQFGRIAQEVSYKELMDAKAREMEAMGLGLQYPMYKAGLGMGLEQQIMGQIQEYLRQQPFQHLVSSGAAGMASPIMGMLGQLGGATIGRL